MVRVVWSEQESLLQVDTKRALSWFGEGMVETLEDWKHRIQSYDSSPFLFGRDRIVWPKKLEATVELDPFPSLLVRFPDRAYPLRLTLDIWGKDVYRARERTAFFLPREWDWRTVFWTVATVWMLRYREPPSWLRSGLHPIELVLYALALLNLREDYFLQRKGERPEVREVEEVFLTFSHPPIALANLLFLPNFSSAPGGSFVTFPDPDRALLAAVQFLDAAQRAWSGFWFDRSDAFLVFGPHGIGKELLEPVLRDLFFPDQGVEVRVPVVRSLLLERKEAGWEVWLFSSFAPLRTRKGSYPWVRSQWLLAPPVGPERVRGLEAMTVLASGE